MAARGSCLKNLNFSTFCHVVSIVSIFSSLNIVIVCMYLSWKFPQPFSPYVHLCQMCSFTKIRGQNKWIKGVLWSGWCGHSRQSPSQLVATLHCLLSTLVQFSLCEGKREAFGPYPILLYHSCSTVTHQAIFSERPGARGIDEGSVCQILNRDKDVSWHWSSNKRG